MDDYEATSAAYLIYWEGKKPNKRTYIEMRGTAVNITCHHFSGSIPLARIPH